jgi:Fis family transcriptional regulator, factor for inversion stimulation protein
MSASGQPAPLIPLVKERRVKPLSDCVRIALERYFHDLDGHKPCQDLYDFVINEVEFPLLKSVMEFTRGNQSRAAEILGINRSTLRKKLEKHDLNK